jgi:hypothetical protein
LFKLMLTRRIKSRVSTLLWRYQDLLWICKLKLHPKSTNNIGLTKARPRSCMSRCSKHPMACCNHPCYITRSFTKTLSLLDSKWIITMPVLPTALCQWQAAHCVLARQWFDIQSHRQQSNSYNGLKTCMPLMILDMSKLSVATLMTILQWFSIFDSRTAPSRYDPVHQVHDWRVPW